MSEKSNGLVVKLCQVMAAIGWVEKSGFNKFHNYGYATEADLVSKLRGELSSRNLFIFPNVTSVNRAAITRVTNSGPKETALTDIMVQWTFVDGDTGETWECNIPGTGEDSGDKGVYKALTGSEKYLLMKAFLIPTGDDPEKDDKEENSNGSKEAQEAVAKQKIAEANYQKREAAQVKGQVVEIYPVQMGDVACVAFVPSAALALLLDRGAKEFTIYSDTQRARYMSDDPSCMIQLEGVAKPLGITVKRLAQGPAASVVAPNGKPAPPKETTIISATPKTKGTSKWLEVLYGKDATESKKLSCWDKDLWPHLKKGVGQTADLITKPGTNPLFTNIVGATRIGDLTFTEIDGKYVPDIQTLPYQGTDEDVSVLR